MKEPLQTVVNGSRAEAQRRGEDEDFAAAIEEMRRPLLELPDLRNPHYTLIIWRRLCGQLGIELTDVRLPDVDALPGHGSIVCMLDTYDAGRMAAVVHRLQWADDPLAVARSWARPWNCDDPGNGSVPMRDRIRLDNKPGDRGTDVMMTVDAKSLIGGGSKV